MDEERLMRAIALIEAVAAAVTQSEEIKDLVLTQLQWQRERDEELGGDGAAAAAAVEFIETAWE